MSDAKPTGVVTVAIEYDESICKNRPYVRVDGVEIENLGKIKIASRPDFFAALTLECLCRIEGDILQEMTGMNAIAEISLEPA